MKSRQTKNKSTKKYPSINDPSISILHKACLEGDYDSLILLAEQDHDKFMSMLIQYDSHGYLPLDSAAEHGHVKIVELLLDKHKSHGFSYEYKMHNKDLYTPLLATVRTFLRIMLAYDKPLNHNIKINPETYQDDYLDIIQMLIWNYPKHINQREDRGFTPLHFVVIHMLKETKNQNSNHCKVISELAYLLMSQGASLDVQTFNGKSPRMFAEEEKTVIDIFIHFEDIIKKKVLVHSNSPQIQENIIPKNTSQKNNWLFYYASLANSVLQVLLVNQGVKMNQIKNKEHILSKIKLCLQEREIGPLIEHEERKYVTDILVNCLYLVKVEQGLSLFNDLPNFIVAINKILFFEKMDSFIAGKIDDYQRSCTKK